MARNKSVLSLMLAASLCACGGGQDGSTASQAATRQALAQAGSRDNILHLIGNLAVENADDLLALVERARSKGANTVVYSDAKTDRWALGQNVGERWITEMRRLRAGVEERGMKLVFETVVMGYCDAPLATDANLTTGYPVIDQPLKAQGGALVPVSTATIDNGGFELYQGNTPSGWTYQDAAGERTFIDTAVKRSGNASFRADARGGAMSRLFTVFAVRPWHQYTLRFWFKTDRLTAGTVLPVIRASGTELELSSQQLTQRNATGDDRVHFTAANNLTLDWTEVRIAFNSQQHTQVDLGLAVFAGESGSIWWDDVSLADTPTLNWITREDLPRSAKRGDGTGTALTVGGQISNPVDPQLGQIGYAGRFANYHEAPQARVLDAAAVHEGDTVLLSGWHALVTAAGQVSCSWNTPRMYALMRTVHQKLHDEFKPEGFLLNYDEVRTGGFEPTDKAFGNSGAAMAASIRRAYDDIAQVAPGTRQYFWSDMVDPTFNARAGFYQVANTLDGSWRTLDPAVVTIVNWHDEGNIVGRGPASLKHFADLGFKQVIGGFYDADVPGNYQRWQTATQAVEGITGSMYATWVQDYGKVEAFGDLWWSAAASTGP
jgi:hypothetical protein